MDGWRRAMIPSERTVIAFPRRISVAALVSIPPIAIKIQLEPESVWARTAAVRQHERIHHISVISAERVRGC